MSTYIALSSFTDQGVRTIKDSTKRADAVIDAPDDASATAFSLAIASAGNVRMQTMRTFSRGEMGGILAKLG